jgi:3-phenylpropionate/trans-cinnamate dioxygenase ferredoxin component
MADHPVFEWMPSGARPPGEGATACVELRGKSVLVCRVEGRLHAVENRCPHAGAALDGGRLDGHVLECPLHGGRLDVRDGSPVEVPIRKPAERFAVREGLTGLVEVLLPQSS